MLIVWDRAFGTFEPERPGKPCIYGLDAQVGAPPRNGCMEVYTSSAPPIGGSPCRRSLRGSARAPHAWPSCLAQPHSGSCRRSIKGACFRHWEGLVQREHVVCTLPCLAQRVVQGTYNPLWHQLHHAAATLRLAAGGKVRPLCGVQSITRNGSAACIPASSIHPTWLTLSSPWLPGASLAGAADEAARARHGEAQHHGRRAC